MINYDAIKREIESTTCAVHHLHPEVTIIDGGNKINIASCCSEFQNLSMEQLQELLAEEAQKAIMDAFNKGLK